MTEHEQVQRWPQVRLDQFHDIDHMNVQLMDALNTLSALAMTQHNWRHRINSDYRAGDSGQHGKGNAVDIVFYLTHPGDVDVWEQFDFAESSRLFMRIGVYPYWNSPGLHLDMKSERLYWIRDKRGLYKYAMTPDEVKALV